MKHNIIYSEEALEIFGKCQRNFDTYLGIEERHLNSKISTKYSHSPLYGS